MVSQLLLRAVLPLLRMQADLPLGQQVPVDLPLGQQVPVDLPPGQQVPVDLLLGQLVLADLPQVCLPADLLPG